MIAYNLTKNGAMLSISVLYLLYLSLGGRSIRAVHGLDKHLIDGLYLDYCLMFPQNCQLNISGMLTDKAAISYLDSGAMKGL